MNGMSPQQRYDDIVRRTGLSENVVRRVLSAERDSIAESLKRGERATLVGRATLVPQLTSFLAIGGVQKCRIKVKASASSALCNELAKYEDFIGDGDDSDEVGIQLTQISALV